METVWLQQVQKALLEPMKNLIKKELRRFLGSPEGVGYVTALGIIPSNYTTGKPTVKFDADAAASGKGYAYVQAYTASALPQANDRVLMLKNGNEWIVVGKLV